MVCSVCHRHVRRSPKEKEKKKGGYAKSSLKKKNDKMKVRNKLSKTKMTKSEKGPIFYFTLKKGTYLDNADIIYNKKD